MKSYCTRPNGLGNGGHECTHCGDCDYDNLDGFGKDNIWDD
ncbi:MAG: hypothetical protein ACRC1M_06670 [Methanobacteriaceae archaeon]